MFLRSIFFYLCVSVLVCVCDGRCSQRSEEWDPLKPVLWAIGSSQMWELATDLGPCARTVGALKLLTHLSRPELKYLQKLYIFCGWLTQVHINPKA